LTLILIILLSGVLGLYRGIASNIASSAPISAIYTYTYESVKGALLPILPKVTFAPSITWWSLFFYAQTFHLPFLVPLFFLNRSTILLHIV